MKIKFRCDKCGSFRLEEVMSGVNQYSEISNIDSINDDEAMIDYSGMISHDDGEVERYQCIECGDILEEKNGNTICCPADLYEYLKERNMLGE